MTGPCMCRPSTTSRHSSATWTLTHVSWRWYSFDPGTLRLADAHYLLGHHDRFGYFSKTGLPWRGVFDLTVNQKLPSFLDDAAAGALPSVSWIDPAFTNFNPLGFPVNDDHPPADIKDGQDLVLAVYDALAGKPAMGPLAAGHRLRRKRRLLRSRPATPGRRRRPGNVRQLRCARTGDHRLAVGGTADRLQHRVRSHLDHQDDPAALLPRGPARAAAGRNEAAQTGVGPAIPGHARGPRQPSRGTPDPHARPTRPAARRPACGKPQPGPHQPNTGQPRERQPGRERPLNDLQKSILAATHELGKRGHPANTP